jgi:hypothetical protein
MMLLLKVAGILAIIPCAAFWFLCGWVHTTGAPAGETEWIWGRPWWFWIAVGTVVTGAVASWTWHGRQAPEAPRCVNCGYNLTGNVSGRCPECGTPIARQDAKAG